MTEIWAHRGACAYAAENTLEAFELAAKMKADAVELDVQMTRDEKLVVIHDETTGRVSGVNMWVKDLSLDELKALCVNKTYPKQRRAQIPTLQEVLDLLLPTGLKINVEFKTGIVFYPGIEEAVQKAVSERGMEERIWYSSFNHYTLRRIREQNPAAKTGMLYMDGIYQAARYAKSLGADALHPAWYNLQYPEFMEEAAQQGLKVHVWTVNEEKELARMRDLGVDAVITNDPALAASVFAKAAS